LHLVGLLFSHINDDARSNSHQVFMYIVSLCSRSRKASCYW